MPTPTATPYGWTRTGAHLLAILTAFLTFVLIGSGGLVTSHGVGMSVPDWPETYGYNMFLFPISRWVGGIFYEHTHRLLASGVGLLTLILAGWIFFVEPRRWVKVLAAGALVAVVLQGVLGGYRVLLNLNQIGIFHGFLAQSFFISLGILAIVTSRRFVEGRFAREPWSGGLRRMALGVTILIFVQLAIAASMRHAHAGLSIPDFPLAYGQWWPDTGAAALERINAARVADNEVPTTAGLIWLQMAHRLVACAIFSGVLAFAWLARTRTTDRLGRGLAWLWVGMILGQIGLGAWTVWSNKAADITTLHVALGALSLFVGGLLTFRLFCAPAGEAPSEISTAGLARDPA
ncbi:MAG TPA: COX15/CtaA family protein [Chthoniobacterales bacterium]